VAESPTPFTLADTARRLGAYRWVELRLFEVVGGWVTTVPELEVKLTLGTQCSHFAWRADLWLAGLPATAELTVDGLTVPATDAVAALLDAVARPVEPGLTIEKLVGVYRVVLPRTIAAYGFHLSHTSTVADAPVIRALRFALGDELEDWRAGEALLQSLIRSEGDARRAATRQAELEVLAVRAGGIAGPGSISGPGPIGAAGSVEGPGAVDPGVECPDPASP
jgi:hypothetical protein